jgi:hypothetical protein
MDPQNYCWKQEIGEDLQGLAILENNIPRLWIQSVPSLAIQ